MKITNLAAVCAILMAAPLNAAPKPEHLEITLAIDSHGNEGASTIPPYEIGLRFAGATPSAYYDKTVLTDWKYFKTDNDLSISSITLFGFAQCFIYGIDGSSTYLKSYGNPVVAQVGPPQTQVNGTCGPHRAA